MISLVPLVDVLLIMLVFFMVTSTYLNLDMIPAAERRDESAPAPSVASGGGAGTLLIRLAPDGRTWLRGRALDRAELHAALAGHLRLAPAAAVSVLASPRADVQALVALMDMATEAGVMRLRILRTEEAQ
jgi:biopolymer transport protein ExbD